MRLSEAIEASDCDLLSEPMIEEALLSPRVRRASRLFRPAGSFSDFTVVEVAGFGPRRPYFGCLPLEAGVAARPSVTAIDGDPTSLRGLTSRSGRTGLPGRGPPVIAAFGVQGVDEPDILGRPCLSVRSVTGVDEAEAD